MPASVTCELCSFPEIKHCRGTRELFLMFIGCGLGSFATLFVVPFLSRVIHKRMEQVSSFLFFHNVFSMDCGSAAPFVV